MTKRTLVRPGDLLAIPLDNDWYGAGIVLHVSREFPGAMLVGYYNLSFPSIGAIESAALGGPFVEPPNYTGKSLVREGRWRVVGHSEALLESATIPELRVVGDLYYKDEITRRIPREEWHQYASLGGGGGAFIENQLRKRLVRPSA